MKERIKKKASLCWKKYQVRFVYLLLLIAAPFFFLGGRSHALRSLEAFWNLGHVLFFALASWICCFLFQYHRPGKHLLPFQIFIFFAFFVLGLLIEGMQCNLDGRFPDSADIFRNQLGCLIAFVFISIGKRKRWKAYVYHFVMTILIAVAVYPVSRAAIDELTALRQFPVLADFETSFELDRWKKSPLLSIQKGLARHGEHSLRVQLTTETYSGASLAYFPGNWQGFDTLFVSIYSPDDKLELTCRIHDAEHNNQYTDRFHKYCILQKGWNNLKISLDEVRRAPGNRLMNMNEIKRIIFFVSQQEKRRIMYIDHIYLEKEAR